jgi:hypothetical protein
MADLLMIVPTRGRPDAVEDLVNQWAATSAGHADLLVVVDEDDPRLSEYSGLRLAPVTDRAVVGSVRWTVGPRERLGGTLNTVSHQYADRYQAIGFMSDGHRPRTNGFDAHLMGELDNLGTGFVYGNDLFRGENVPTAIAMTSDIIRTLGYMVPGGLVHLYITDAWADLGHGIGRLRYLPDVVIEHLPPSPSEIDRDASRARRDGEAWYSAVSAELRRYENWKQCSLEADLTRLRTLIGTGGLA